MEEALTQVQPPTSGAMSNEERFVAACRLEGEAGVRQKLATSRYSEVKAGWASGWLEEVESGKSDATKAQERSAGILNAKKPGRYLAAAAIIIVLVLVCGVAFLELR